MKNTHPDSDDVLVNELQVKLLDQITSLLSQKESGEITNAQYKTAIETAFNICSGLISHETFALISEAVKEVQIDQSFMRFNVLVNGENLVILTTSVKNKGRDYLTRRFDCVIHRSLEKDGKTDGESFSSVENEAYIGKTIDKMLRNGFEEID